MLIQAPPVQPPCIAAPPWAAGAPLQTVAQARGNYVLPRSDKRYVHLDPHWAALVEAATNRVFFHYFTYKK